MPFVVVVASLGDLKVLQKTIGPTLSSNFVLPAVGSIDFGNLRIKGCPHVGYIRCFSRYCCSSLPMKMGHGQ